MRQKNNEKNENLRAREMREKDILRNKNVINKVPVHVEKNEKNENLRAREMRKKDK